MKEDQFWGFLTSKEDFSPPIIDGKPVNLFMLFNMVHRNGGAAKVSTPVDEGCTCDADKFRRSTAVWPLGSS